MEVVDAIRSYRQSDRIKRGTQLPTLACQPQGQLTIFAGVAIDEVLQH
jgi:hypothetical protein